MKGLAAVQHRTGVPFIQLRFESQLTLNRSEISCGAYLASDGAGLDGDVDALGHLDQLERVDFLHGFCKDTNVSITERNHEANCSLSFPQWR